MRILVAGAGIAGLTLTGLLRRRGASCVLVERAEDFTHTGYMLGLYPMAGRVLHALGLHEAYIEHSQPTATYSLYSSRGRHVKDYSFEVFTKKYGEYQMLSRGGLVELLLQQVPRDWIRTGVTIESLEQSDDEVRVKFDNGESGAFDLVVGADGMFSSMRSMVYGETPARKTGWGGWIWWVDSDIGARETVSEYWMRGAFAGIYPTQKRAGLFVGGPNRVLQSASSDEIAGFLRDHFSTSEGPVSQVLDTTPEESGRFYWELLDVRSPEWVRGRVVLLGDAGAGFLPTAGIGASMAMESAAALNDELSRTNAAFVPSALDYFVKRRKKRVERAQQNSRSLARLMFTESRALAWARDVLMRFYTMEQALKPIVDIMDSPL